MLCPLLQRCAHAWMLTMMTLQSMKDKPFWGKLSGATGIRINDKCH